MSKNLYNILGVSKTATDAEIKSAYRKLARKYHPDVNKDNKQASDKFKEISGAYEILKDKDKRKQYDNGEIDSDGKPAGFGAGTGGNYYQYSPGGGNPFGSEGFNGGAGGFDFSDIFGEDIFSAFGGRAGRAPKRPRKGQDIAYNMQIDFLSAALGDEKTIPIMGKNLKVKIPAGSKTGQSLRLKGLGQSGINGGPAGDVLITMNVGKHSYFVEDGSNILLEVPVSIKEAVLGAKITVPTIYGNVVINIPPYSSSGDKLRLKGKGVKGKNGMGDQLVNLKIISPAQKNKDLEEALSKIDDKPVRKF